MEFCVKHLSRPGSKAAIDERQFFDIKPDVFLARRLETAEKVKTLAGISSKFQYVCEVDLKTFFEYFHLILFSRWTAQFDGEGIPASAIAALVWIGATAPLRK